jgi:hypothetical protein
MSDDDFGAAAPAGPEWAPYFDAEAYAAFASKVVAHLEDRGFTCAEDDGVVILRRGDQESRCGLQNLAQICNQNPRAEWGEIISEHFEKVLGVLVEGEGMEADADDFEAVRGQLRPRLMSEESLQQAGIECIAQPVAEDLVAVAVFDLPDTTMTVRADYLETWEKTPEEVLRVATENLAAAEDLAPGMQRFDLEGGGFLHVYGDDYYTASHLLLLERYLGPNCPFGALVAIPHRHVLLVHPLQDLRVVPTLNSLIGIALGMFEEGPGSITPHLFWWRREGMVRLPITVGDGKVSFAPPPEFLEVLEALEEPPTSIS